MENRISLVSAWGWETNPYANPDTCNNGGGYFQPEGGVVLEVGGDLLSVLVEDYSCGGFGDRIFLTISAPAAGMVWRINIGTMSDACLATPEEEDETAASIWGVLGLDFYQLVAIARDAVGVCACCTPQWEEGIDA